LQGLRLFSSPTISFDAALGGALASESERSIVLTSKLAGTARLADSIRLGAGVVTLGESCAGYLGLEVTLFDKYMVGVDCFAGLRDAPETSDSFTKTGDFLFGLPDDGVNIQVHLGSVLF
jgi:hypothetical protein